MSVDLYIKCPQCSGTGLGGGEESDALCFRCDGHKFVTLDSIKEELDVANYWAEHCYALFIALCQEINTWEHNAWRSPCNSDGIITEGWFLLGLSQIEFGEPGKQIAYYLPQRLWEKTNFARFLPKAPAWDDEVPGDVLNRLYTHYIG